MRGQGTGDVARYSIFIVCARSLSTVSCLPSTVSSRPRWVKYELPSTHVTFLRWTIYMGGGLVLTALYVMWMIFDTDRATATFVLWGVPFAGLLALIFADRWIHSALFGNRVAIHLDRYVFCGTCPFTGKEARIRKNYTFSMHAFGPIDATMYYKFPLLISEEAASRFPKDDIDKVPGFKIVRISARKAVIYIKDKQYYDAFVSANERALI